MKSSLCPRTFPGSESCANSSSSMEVPEKAWPPGLLLAALNDTPRCICSMFITALRSNPSSAPDHVVLRTPGSAPDSIRFGARNGVAQHNCLGDVFHRLSHLLTLALDFLIRLLLADAEIALQKALGPLHQSAYPQPLRQLRVLLFQPGHLSLGTHQETDGRNQPNFALAVMSRLTVLNIDNADQPSPADQANQEEGLEALIGCLVK